MNPAPTPAQERQEAVRDYKSILQRVIETRPSGTRNQLAVALGKNRSFISQLTNPLYPTPIPQKHVGAIFEICHFTPEEKKAFLERYAIAHPNRHESNLTAQPLRAHTLYLPDLGDERQNARLQALVADFVKDLAEVMKPRARDRPGKGEAP